MFPSYFFNFPLCFKVLWIMNDAWIMKHCPCRKDSTEQKIFNSLKSEAYFETADYFFNTMHGRQFNSVYNTHTFKDYKFVLTLNGIWPDQPFYSKCIVILITRGTYNIFILYKVRKGLQANFSLNEKKLFESNFTFTIFA